MKDDDIDEEEDEELEEEVEEPTPKKKKFSNKNKVFIFVSVALALSVLLNLYLFFGVADLSGNAAMDIAEEFIEANLVEAGTDITVKDVVDVGDVYQFTIAVDNNQFLSYITKDGTILFPSGFLVSSAETTTSTPASQPIDVPKSDKPVVELFVMSHCPFGTQAEKGIIPAVELLGNKIDFNIRFVFYAMHGETEVTEQLRQYCIQKEQESKFIDYLKCFLADGNSERCLDESGIDRSKLESCMEKADKEFSIRKNLEDSSLWLNGRYPLFNIDKKLNEEYGVGGSPSFVINGQEVSSARDSASLLNAICSAFNEAPEECSETLSSTSPSAGFGYSAGTATDASCG